MTKTEYQASAAKIRWLLRRSSECARLDLVWTGQKYFSLASEKQSCWPFRFLQPKLPEADFAHRLNDFKNGKDIPF